MKIRHLTYFIMLNFINQRAYFQRISYNFNEVLFIKDGLKNGFKDKELNKTGCISILVAVVGLLVLVSMCSH